MRKIDIALKMTSILDNLQSGESLLLDFNAYERERGFRYIHAVRKMLNNLIDDLVDETKDKEKEKKK